VAGLGIQNAWVQDFFIEQKWQGCMTVFSPNFALTRSDVEPGVIAKLRQRVAFSLPSSFQPDFAQFVSVLTTAGRF